MTNPPQDQINALVDLYQSGLLTKTEATCRQLLHAYPQSLIVINFLGAVLLGLNRFQEAVQYFDQAIKLKPDYAQAYSNRGNALSSLGDYEGALMSCNKAIAIDPNQAEAYCNRGNALRSLGQFKEALTDYDSAIKINPSFALAYCNRGNVLKDLEKPEDAIDSYDMAIRLAPTMAIAYNNRGNILRDLGRLGDAADSCLKAIQLKPDYVLAYCNYANVLRDQGRYMDAIDNYNKIIDIAPAHSEAHSCLCEIYEKQNLIQDLKITLTRAQTLLAKDDPLLLFHQAQLASREKHFENARNYLELINIDDLPLLMKQGYSELLAKSYDKLGEYAKAFTQFKITNDLARHSIYARDCVAQRYVDRVALLSTSWKDVDKIEWSLSLKPPGHSLAFLVGFPRSGTTLLDTILRSHPDVSVVEEQPMVDTMQACLGDIATVENLNRLDENQITRLREVYLKELYIHNGQETSSKLIVDKLPLNIINAGLIHRVFPEARFILSLRHPVDCVLSCFMQNFKLNDAMANFLSLHQSADLYDEVMQLWQRYAHTLPLEIGVIKYEEMVQDLQGTVEPVLNFLDLNWDSKLLDFQQTALSRGMINTPSYNQVTQGLHTQAINRWRKYQNETSAIAHQLQPWAEKYGYKV